MRPRIIVANWKMHKTFDAGLQLVQEIISQLRQSLTGHVQIILLAPFIHLEAIGRLLPSSGNLYIGAQNCHEKPNGAFTGEIAAPMLQSIGVHFVLIGHSERRQYFGEDNALSAQKVTTALAHGLRPILCCGETWQIREKDQQITFVTQQLTESLFHLSPAQVSQIIIAYEPAWAIDTGQILPPAQIKPMHQALRDTLAQKYGISLAATIPILYGGSCNPQYARALLALSAADGVLLGRASLQSHTFFSIMDVMV